MKIVLNQTKRNFEQKGVPQFDPIVFAADWSEFHEF